MQLFTQGSRITRYSIRLEFWNEKRTDGWVRVRLDRVIEPSSNSRMAMAKRKRRGTGSSMGRP